MSVVVALKQDGVIYMGADTACTSGLTYNTVRGSLAKLSKIGHTLIGFTGDSCARQVIIGHPEILACGEEGLTRRWIVTQFIPKYRELCREMGWLKENEMLSTDVFLAQKDTL
ncbi:MAG: hypothetical protein J5755_00775, partial [Clostridia bacterium]|nr:hypothetical protein [Clostridia bacterium]